MAELTQEQKASRLAEIDAILAERQASADAINELSPSGKELRMSDIDDELARRGISPPVQAPKLTPPEVYQRDKEFVELATDPNTQELGFSDIRSYQPQIAKNETIVGEGDNEHTFVDSMKELKRWEKAIQILGPIGDTFTIGEGIRATNSVKIANAKVGDFVNITPLGRFTDIGQRPVRVTPQLQTEANEFLEQWMTDLENTRNLTTGGKFARVLINAPEFLLEFWLTRGAYTAGKKSFEKVAVKALGDYAEHKTGKLAIRAASAGFGSLVRTGVNVPEVLSGASEKMTEGLMITDSGAYVFSNADKSPWSALASSFTDLYIENVTEIAGGKIGEGFSFAGKGIGEKFPILGKFTKELGEKWLSTNSGKTMADFLKLTQTKIGFDGVLQEMGEERLADVLRAATGKDEWSDVVPTMENMLIELGLFTTIGGANLAATKLFRKNAPRVKPITEKGQLVGVERLPDLTFEDIGRGEEVPLFDSYKNQALAEAENQQMMKFLNEAIAGKPKKPVSAGQPKAKEAGVRGPAKGYDRRTKAYPEND
jgi:hypothetical protein